MTYIYSFGPSFERHINNVELVEHTDKQITLAFAAGPNTTEKGIRNLLVGDPAEHAVDFCQFTLEEQDEENSNPVYYYGYTKLSKFEKYQNEDGTDMCRVTLRKPTINEFVEDMYCKVCNLTDATENLMMNVGGSYNDMVSDTTKIMMNQLGGV